MTRTQLVATAAASVGIALVLGLIDYESRSVWQLFNAENAPFILALAASAFGLLVCLQVAVRAVFWRRGRSK